MVSGLRKWFGVDRHSTRPPPTPVPSVATVGREIARDLAPDRIGATVGAALVAGTLTVSYGVSLAAFIFSGEVAESLSDGVGMMMWSTFVLSLVATFRSPLAGTIPSAGGKTAAVLAAGAAGLATQVEPDALTTISLTQRAIGPISGETLQSWHAGWSDLLERLAKHAIQRAEVAS